MSRLRSPRPPKLYVAIASIGFVVTTLILLRPAGTAHTDTLRQKCGLPIGALLPSEPMPSNDARYRASETCHHQQQDRAFLATIPALISVAAAARASLAREAAHRPA